MVPEANGSLLVDEVRAAEILGTSRRFLQARRMLGQPPRWTKIGRLCRYRLSDLETFIQDGMSSPADEKGGGR